MPNFQVSLRQGKNYKTVNVESSSVSKVLEFFNLVSTMKVTEIKEVVYVSPSDVVPMDDFNYHSVVKTFAKNKAGGVSKDFLFNNIKKTVNEQELFLGMKEFLTVDGLHIDSIYATLFKTS